MSRAINRPGYRGGAVTQGTHKMKPRMLCDRRTYWRSAVLAAPLAGALFGIAVPAQAIRYIGTSSIGQGTVDLSIDTDGKIGALAASNIVAWKVTLHDPSSATPLRTLDV